jgi:hypothetical protein
VKCEARWSGRGSRRGEDGSSSDAERMSDSDRLSKNRRRRNESSSTHHKRRNEDDFSGIRNRVWGRRVNNRYSSDDDYECNSHNRRGSRSSTMEPVSYSHATSVATFLTFLTQFEVCADYNNWSKADCAAQLKCCLNGAASQIL